MLPVCTQTCPTRYCPISDSLSKKTFGNIYLKSLSPISLLPFSIKPPLNSISKTSFVAINSALHLATLESHFLFLILCDRSAAFNTQSLFLDRLSSLGHHTLKVSLYLTDCPFSVLFRLCAECGVPKARFLSSALSCLHDPLTLIYSHCLNFLSICQWPKKRIAPIQTSLLTLRLKYLSAHRTCSFSCLIRNLKFNTSKTEPLIFPPEYASSTVLPISP